MDRDYPGPCTGTMPTSKITSITATVSCTYGSASHTMNLDNSGTNCTSGANSCFTAVNLEGCCGGLYLIGAYSSPTLSMNVQIGDSGSGPQFSFYIDSVFSVTPYHNCGFAPPYGTTTVPYTGPGTYTFTFSGPTIGTSTTVSATVS